MTKLLTVALCLIVSCMGEQVVDVKTEKPHTVFGWNMGDAPPLAYNDNSVELNQQYIEVCIKDPDSCDFSYDATKPLVQRFWKNTMIFTKDLFETVGKPKSFNQAKMQLVRMRPGAEGLNSDKL